MHDAILDKIRKLHALAESPCNEAEAAVAAARVQDLLAKHNLELGQVVLKEDPGAQLGAGRTWRRFPSHVWNVASACDEMFDVLHIYSGFRRAGHKIVFLGLKANVEAAVITYEYLMASVESLVTGAKTLGLIYGTEEFRAFRDGAAARIQKMARERKAQALAANPEYGELVHIGNAMAWELHNAIKFTGKGRSGGWRWGSVGTAAYSHGYEQGSRVDLAGARSSRMLE